MATGTGLDASVGIGAESGYGTYHVPTRWLPFDGESLAQQKNTVTANSIVAGTLYPLANFRKVTTRAGAGTVTMPFWTAGMGLWLDHCFGTSAIAADTPVAGVSTMTFSPGGLAGKSFTLQKALPTSSGSFTKEPFSYIGCKITDVEFSLDTNGILMVTFTVDAKDELTLNDDATKTLVTPTIPVVKPFSFLEASTLTLGGTPVASARAWSLKHTRGTKTDRFYLGGGGLKNEPLENAHRAVTGKITAEFTTRAALYDSFDADTSLALVHTLTDTSAPITGSTYASVSFSVPTVKLDGETPKVGGTDVLALDAGYTGFGASAVTVTVVTGDAAL